MRNVGWFAFALIAVSFAGAWALITQIKGNEFVVTVASVCVFLIWFALAFRIAKWADHELKYAKDKKSDKVKR